MRRMLIMATILLLVLTIIAQQSDDNRTVITTSSGLTNSPAVAESIAVANIAAPPNEPPAEPEVVRAGRSSAVSNPPEDVPLVIDDSLHPLSIDWLRGRTYPGSDFVIEQVLEPGVNYHRMVVSYLSDGYKINALMTIPQTPKPPTGFPVIIFNHGFIPPDEYRTTERYVAYVDAFARSGYIVIKSDYRGHGFSEGPATSVYGDPGYVVDVLNALASARRHPDADPDRIGMWGHSMGGYISLRAMVADQNIRAASIWAGVVASYDDLFANWFNPGVATRRTWRTELVEQFGTPGENPAFWDSVSANAYLDSLTGPVQLHHGTADTSVPFNFSILLDEEIRAAGGASELFLYPNDDHNISTNLDTALLRSVIFFDTHVKGI